jgi:hypothetical protein
LVGNEQTVEKVSRKLVDCVPLENSYEKCVLQLSDDVVERKNGRGRKEIKARKVLGFPANLSVATTMRWMGSGGGCGSRFAAITIAI